VSNPEQSLPAFWIVRKAVVAVTNTIAVTIAVITVDDAITIEIAVRTNKPWLIPPIACITRIVVIGEPIAIMVAVRVAALPVIPVIASAIIEAPKMVRFGCEYLVGLHTLRCSLSVNSWNRHANRKVQVACGMCR